MTRRICRTAVLAVLTVLFVTVIALAGEHSPLPFGAEKAYAGSSWQRTGSGTYYYAVFPSGYNTGSLLYKEYNKTKLTAYENATNKRTVTTTRSTWIYWHWTWRVGATNNNKYNYYIHKNSSGDESHASYPYWADFESSTNYPENDPDGHHDSTPGLCFYHWRNNVNDGSWWWFRIPVYKQTYTDYKLVQTQDPAPQNPVTKIYASDVKTDSFVISWPVPSGTVDGYQVQYSTKSDFSDCVTLTLSGKNNCSLWITGLKAGCTYYIRIRIYVISNNQYNYSSWSGVWYLKTQSQPQSQPAAQKKDISNKSVSISGISAKTYSGKSKKCSIAVKSGGTTLVEGRDYTVKYKNNKKVGIAIIIIKGCGNYTGTIKRTFKINPKGTRIKKVTRKAKSITVKWKKRSKNCSGYQIRYSTKSNFSKCKKKTIKGRKKGGCTIKKLSPNTKYYIEIRIYYIVKGKKYWSSWSKVKTVRTKKITAVKSTVYDKVIKKGNTVYCSDSYAIYRVNLKTNTVKRLYKGTRIFAMKLYKGYIYFGDQYSTDTSCGLFRGKASGGSYRELVRHSGQKYAIYGSKIYYDESWNDQENPNWRMDLDGSDKEPCRIKAKYKRKTANKKGYNIVIKESPDYQHGEFGTGTGYVVSYLRKPNGSMVKLGRTNASEMI